MAVSAHVQQKIGLKYLKSWCNWQNFPFYRKLGTQNSNLGSYFSPEVDLLSFLHMRSKKMAKMVQNASELAKIPVLYETEHGELNFGVNS